MANTPRVFDCDSHVLEPTEIWTKYLDADYRVLARSVFWHEVDEIGVPVTILNGKQARELNSNGINRQVFGGWQISGNTTIQSGTPFTVFNSSNDFSGFNQFNDRPDVVGTGRLVQNNSNPDAAFATTFFGCSTPPCNTIGKGAPPVGRVGNSGRNQYYGPGLQNWNFSTSKLFPLGTERVHLRFEADFFNLFNHTNFSNPISNESSGNFGRITSTLGSATATAVGTTAGVVGGGPRIIQGALRVVF